MSKQAFTVQFFVLLRTLSEFFTSKTHLRISLKKSVPKCFLSRPIIVFNVKLMAQCTAYSTIDFIIHRLRPSPGVAKSCEIGKMPDITSSVKIQTASTSSVGRKSPWKMCQILSTNTQRFPWYTFEGVDFLFFNGELWQTLFCCRHLLELNLRWSKFMQTGTLVIKLSPSSSSSLSWSSSSSPSLSSSPWKIAEFSRRPNDQITIDHTCRGLSEHCLSSKEKIAYRYENMRKKLS